MPSNSHPFAAKFPAQRAHDIRPADVWPAVGWDATAGRLLLTVTHMVANMPVEVFPAGDLMLGALCLFCTVATETLPSMDTATLIQRDGNHHWASYRAAMTDLVTHLASSPPKRVQALQQETATHVAPFRDVLRSASADAFLHILAGDDDPKRPIHRIPLIHWLLHWHAPNHNWVLHCQITPSNADQVLPAPCPLSAQQWNTKLAKHCAALTHTGILTRISFRRKELSHPNAASAEPLWKKMLLHKDTAHPSDFTVDIERLANVPDSHAEHIAQSARVLGGNMALPESATAALRAVKSARALVSAVKTMWLVSLTTTRTALQAALLDLINTIKEQHGSSSLEDQWLAVLCALDPLIDTAAVHPGLSWSTLSASLLAVRPSMVPSNNVVLYLEAAHDPISYRVATSAAVQSIARPRCLERFVEETRTSLAPASNSAAVYEPV